MGQTDKPGVAQVIKEPVDGKVIESDTGKKPEDAERLLDDQMNKVEGI